MVKKVDMEVLTFVLGAEIKDGEMLNKLLSKINEEQSRLESEKKAEAAEKIPVEWEHCVVDSNSTYWVVDVDKKVLAESNIDSLIEMARSKFNQTKSGLKSPISKGAFADCFEFIPAKIWKSLGVRVKTKEPAYPCVVNK